MSLFTSSSHPPPTLYPLTPPSHTQQQPHLRRLCRDTVLWPSYPALRPTTHRTHIFPLNPLTRRSGRSLPRPRSLIVHLQATIIYPLAICPIHSSLLRPLSIHTHSASTYCPLNVITPGLLLSIPVILTRPKQQPSLFPPLTFHRPPTIHNLGSLYVPTGSKLPFSSAVTSCPPSMVLSSLILTPCFRTPPTPYLPPRANRRPLNRTVPPLALLCLVLSSDLCHALPLRLEGYTHYLLSPSVYFAARDSSRELCPTPMINLLPSLVVNIIPPCFPHILLSFMLHKLSITPPFYGSPVLSLVIYIRPRVNNTSLRNKYCRSSSPPAGTPPS